MIEGEMATRTGRRSAQERGIETAAAKATMGADAERAGSASASSAEDACRERRAPLHERGRQRVCAILDAASTIIAEGTLSELTIEGIAKRSGASKSSMYHFFPDRDTVIEALVERHWEDIRAQDALRPDAVEWTTLTAEAAVDRFLEPMQAYIRRHPDFVPLMQVVGSNVHIATILSQLDALQIARAERLVAAHAPDSTTAQRRARAATVVSMVVGVCELSGRQSSSVRSGMMREVRVALIAYLKSLR